MYPFDVVFDVLAVAPSLPGVKVAVVALKIAVKDTIFAPGSRQVTGCHLYHHGAQIENLELRPVPRQDCDCIDSSRPLPFVLFSSRSGSKYKTPRLKIDTIAVAAIASNTAAAAYRKC